MYRTILFFMMLLSGQLSGQSSLLSDLQSPVLFKGDEKTAYRDPALLYHGQKLYLFFTLVKTETDGKVYSYTAMSVTQDLKKMVCSGDLNSERPEP